MAFAVLAYFVLRLSLCLLLCGLVQAIVNKKTNKQINRQRDRRTTDRQTHRLSDRYTERQRDRQTSNLTTYWRQCLSVQLRLSVQLQQCNARVISRKTSCLLEHPRKVKRMNNIYTIINVDYCTALHRAGFCRALVW